MIVADFHLPGYLRAVVRKLVPIACSAEAVELEIVENVVDEIELFMRGLGREGRMALCAGLVAFDLSATVLPRSFGRRFIELDSDRAQQHFQRWWAGKLPLMHTFAKGIKGVIAVAYYEHPKVKARIGYDPELWIADVSTARLQRWQREIVDHERAVLERDPLVSTPDSKARVQ
jgi:hypothetical protein